MSAVVSVSLLTLVAGLTITPIPVAFAQETPAPAAHVPVSVTLPSPSLPDAEYKASLATLLEDPVQRPNVYAALLRLLQTTRKQPVPTHARVITELMTERLESPNLLETILPLRILGRCGVTAQSAAPKVLTLSDSKLGRVRAAAAEALGGMYIVWDNDAVTAPSEVKTALLRLATDSKDRSTRRAAAVSLGRAHISDSQAVTVLAAIAGSDDSPVAVGALDAAENLGPKAHLMLPSIVKCLSDAQRVNNAVPALLAVATPQEAADAMAQVLPITTNYTVRQTILYYAEQMPVKKGEINTTVLANAVKPLMDAVALPTPAAEATAPTTPAITTDTQEGGTGTTEANTTPKDPAPVEYNPTEEDLVLLRVAAARTYVHLSGDTTTAATSLSALATDAAVSPAVRRQSLQAIAKLGPTAAKSPVVIKTLTTALEDSDTTVQNAAADALFKLSGPASVAAAPRLSAMLLTAWQNKENSRVYTLINALYRIGPAAAKSATPVFKKILAGEPKNSANARYAQLALERMKSK